MEFILIDVDSTEWVYMWDWLSSHPLNNDLEEPKSAENNGVAWEYVGSFMQDKRVVHEYIHQSHPKTQGPVKLSLNASTEFTEDTIARKFRIK